MAPQRPPHGAEKKRKSKKKKSRTEVSSSSESDSEQEQRQPSRSNTVAEKAKSSSPEPTPASQPAKKSKKKSKPSQDDEDVSMIDAEPIAPSTSIKTAKEIEDEFDAIYLRKLTTEVADDLDKVREAPDFKANSIPMLIHALKQGESLYSAEEKRRMVAAAGQ